MLLRHRTQRGHTVTSEVSLSHRTVVSQVKCDVCLWVRVRMHVCVRVCVCTLVVAGVIWRWFLVFTMTKKAIAHTQNPESRMLTSIQNVNEARIFHCRDLKCLHLFSHLNFTSPEIKKKYSSHSYLLLTERKHVEGRLPEHLRESSRRKRGGVRIVPSNQETGICWMPVPLALSCLLYLLPWLKGWYIPILQMSKLKPWDETLSPRALG